MEKHIIRQDSIQLTEKEVFAALSMPAESEDHDFIWNMARECMKIAVPKAVYCVAAIEAKEQDAVIVEGNRFCSPLVRKNLEKVNRIIPFVATCGVEAQQWSNQYTDMLENYWADGIKMILLSKIRKTLSDRIKADYFPKSDMSAMSPGSLIEWPLPEQGPLFNLIGNVTGDIGVRLTDSFLMLPSKSSSGFFFSSTAHYENCALCPILDCPGRRAPYQPK